MSQGPKIVVIGAGSFFFGRAVVYNMAQSPILQNGTLALVDTDPHVLKTMLNLARRAKEYSRAPFELLGSTDRRTVMKNADFVVSSFSFRNTHYRGTDVRIARKYGVPCVPGTPSAPAEFSGPSGNSPRSSGSPAISRSWLLMRG